MSVDFDAIVKAKFGWSDSDLKAARQLVDEGICSNLSDVASLGGSSGPGPISPRAVTRGKKKGSDRVKKMNSRKGVRHDMPHFLFVNLKRIAYTSTQRLDKMCPSNIKERSKRNPEWGDFMASGIELVNGPMRGGKNYYAFPTKEDAQVVAKTKGYTFIDKKGLNRR